MNKNHIASIYLFLWDSLLVLPFCEQMAKTWVALSKFSEFWVAARAGGSKQGYPSTHLLHETTVPPTPWMKQEYIVSPVWNGSTQPPTPRWINMGINLHSTVCMKAGPLGTCTTGTSFHFVFSNFKSTAIVRQRFNC